MLEEKIESDLTQAMKAKNEVVVSALRNLKAEMKNTAIAKGEALTDEEVLKVLAKKVKQHKDSIENFAQGQRDDLIQTESAQMAVLSEYLPQQLDEAAVKKLVLDVIANTKATPQDFGRVMKEVMVQAAGRADGKVVSKLVKENLT